ncbi:MAG: SDR family oxidoreductase [Anaerolineae bacterium]
MMNLVVGATGMLGSEICRRLADAGKPVRALVRTTSDPAKVATLRGCGAEIVEGDLRDADSLRAACQGATAVISTASSMPFAYQPGENDVQTVDAEGAINLVDAAQAAGVAHFVYTSFTMDNDFPLRNAKRAVERRLHDSGLTYTVLRPSYFMEVWLSPAVGFDYPNAKARIYGSGQNPLSLIALPDVAQFAVASLDNPAARSTTLAIGGPEAVSQLQAVQVFEEGSRQTFQVEHVPEEALAQQQAASTDLMEQSFAGLMQWYARGDAVDMEETLKAFPMQLTSVQDYAQSALGAS